MPTTRELAHIYKEAHSIMRNVDGLQPQEAFDELLKYLFFKQNHEVITKDIKPITYKKVRELFSDYLGKTNSWSSEIWREHEIFLSDACLSDIHCLLFTIDFSKINFDVRSHALKEFLTPEIRKGLGVFLTPDDVVSAIIDFIPNQIKLKVIDPACGSGTFLIEYLKKLNTNNKSKVFGIDKSPRMLLLADLNLGHFPKVKFEKRLTDSLRDTKINDEFDVIFTNPPFGVSLDARDYDFDNYISCKDGKGYPLKKQTSEIVFIERCLQKLKPSGTLAIVIPKSIATNNTLQLARTALSTYGYIYGVMSLPPETFASTGTQTTTIVLFVRKYKNKNEKNEPINLALATINNVGFDSTGRKRDGNILPYFANTMNESINTGKPCKFVELISYTKKSETFEKLSDVFISKPKNKNDLLLGSLCQFIGTGRTPARKNYSEEGNFLIKVGNLTGAGIKWAARDRNFINDEETTKRQKAKKPLILKVGDILLTSSAHSPVYIAKKSDIFTGIPSFLTTKHVSFVGEVMLVRVDTDKIDPYLLLAFLRSTEAINTIQKMVRGQTAHLHPKDISQLVIPKNVFKAGSNYEKAAEIIKEQHLLNEKMNSLVAMQSSLLNSDENLALA
ncbi:MAG: N-6 DNA methylase [Methylococcales symbiont of Iophon sp. n. MRB-2018]|nr:MAG: N-6 DNA methylase [Methylococcales symbiont of Iophon sp. n. MRB-2018]